MEEEPRLLIGVENLAAVVDIVIRNIGHDGGG